MSRPQGITRVAPLCTTDKHLNKPFQKRKAREIINPLMGFAAAHGCSFLKIGQLQNVSNLAMHWNPATVITRPLPEGCVCHVHACSTKFLQVHG